MSIGNPLCQASVMEATTQCLLDWLDRQTGQFM
jgi:hypothetical protein